MTSKSDARRFGPVSNHAEQPKAQFWWFLSQPNVMARLLGVFPSSTEDAVVAAVRLAYKVAEKQVARAHARPTLARGWRSRRRL